MWCCQCYGDVGCVGLWDCVGVVSGVPVEVVVSTWGVDGCDIVGTLRMLVVLVYYCVSVVGVVPAEEDVGVGGDNGCDSIDVVGMLVVLV